MSEAPPDPAPEPRGRAPGGLRGHPWWRSPWARVLLASAAVALVVVLVLEGRSAAHDIAQTLSHFSATTLPWLLAAAAAEAISFYCYAAVQRRLLMAGGARLSRRSMVGLAVASTGLTNLVPGGVAPAGGWLVGQYRRRGVPMPLALWSVLAGGVASTVSVLVVLLLGLGIAALVGPLWLVVAAALVVAVTSGLVAAVHRLATVTAWIGRHERLRGNRLVQAGLAHAATAAEFRATLRGGTHVYALSLCNWLMDVVVLVCAFLALGLPVPWRGVLFAYAVAQLAGSLTPLPGGIGAVEGGMVGAFAVTGTPVGAAFLATIVYRFVTSWAVAAVGSVALVLITRHGPPESARLEGPAARIEADRPVAPLEDGRPVPPGSKASGPPGRFGPGPREALR